MEMKKVNIFLGTGGVGKTTLSAIYALKLAQENPNKKIKLITIDPSKRLKDYFDMNVEVTEKQFENLSVSMKSREALLKDFILSAYSGSECEIKKIFDNKLFKRLMGGLSVSQEFSSLYEIVKSQSENFDLLIVDTPPLQNAGSFLNGAKDLEGLFSSTLVDFFIPPVEQNLIQKIFFKARHKSFNILSKLTGASFVDELANFFGLVEKVRPELLSVIGSAKEILEKNTDLTCVCNFNELSLKGLDLSIKSMGLQGFEMKSCYVNKFTEAKLQNGVVGQVFKKLEDRHGAVLFKKIEMFSFEPKNRFDLLKLGEEIEL